MNYTFDKVRVVMVNTTEPGNIGAAARAMKNMNLSRLYLVNPKGYPSAVATARASGADDLLANAVVCESLEGALQGVHLVIGASARQRNIKWKQMDVYLAMFKAIHPQVAGIRRAGSAALDLAYLAAGRLDGFWEIELNIWDIAAGVLLVKEAGGFVGDFSGRDKYLETGNVVAGNDQVFKEILKTIHPHLTTDLQR